jgi:type II secretory pathway pseudopilin PulG
MKMTSNSQKGFSLIEAVVAAGVFAFVVAASLGVYMSVIKLDSKTRSERAVQQNARFILDYLSKEIRNGVIDYTRENDQDTLSIINQMDQELQINWTGATQRNLVLTKTGIGTTNLNSDDVYVTNFVAYLTPSHDPFNLANDVHIQPHVTIVLQLQSTRTKSGESATMNIETTFTVRDYRARQ